MAVKSKRRRQEHHNDGSIHGVPQMLAERVGFEPTEVLPSHDFQSCAFDRTMLPLLGTSSNEPIIPPLPVCAKSRPPRRLTANETLYLVPSSHPPTLKF
jgi:hypothetical protein